jgi:hypothetical protein
VLNDSDLPLPDGFQNDSKPSATFTDINPVFYKESVMFSGKAPMSWRGRGAPAGSPSSKAAAAGTGK